MAAVKIHGSDHVLPRFVGVAEADHMTKFMQEGAAAPR